MVEQQQQDVKWKRIQLNTFTRWVKQKLEKVNVTVSDLKTDFEEGLKLIRLVEVLSGKSFGRYNKKVIFRHQKLENISLALQFLENEEQIKLINIDSSAIADHNLKLILGLVWTLILHYSISKQVLDHPSGELESNEISAKKKLLIWLKTKLPAEVTISNFTFDWNNGIRLGALVNSCAPDLEVGWQKWLPSDALQSTRTAMRLANDYLGVTALIEPEELISPAIDEKSVMTYLSQFPGAKYTPLGRLDDVMLMPEVGISTRFTLQTRDAMVIPDVIIKGPNESSVHYTQYQLSETAYEFIYQPEIPGEHEIMVTVRDNVSGDSAKPRTKVVAVEGTHTSSILVDGLNNETVIVGQRNNIIIDIGNLKPKKNGLEVTVEKIGKVGGPKYLIPLGREHNSNTYRGFWTAEELGEMKVCVFFDESLVREYSVIVQHGEDATQCQAVGEGLEHAVVGMPAKFLIDEKDGGKGKTEVSIKGPSEVKTNVVHNENGLCAVEYITATPGLYEIAIYLGEQKKQIRGSPFMMTADYKRDPSKIVITEYNNGLARAGIPNLVIVDATLTAYEPVSARLPADFEQPIVEEIRSRVYRVTFIPSATTSQTIALELLYGGELIGKPMIFVVKPDEELESMVLKSRSGGFLSSTAQASFQFEALIDVTKAGNIDELVAKIKGPDGKLRKPVVTEDCHKGMYLLDFIPDLAGVYVIMIYVNGKPFSDPYTFTAVPVGSADKCVVESKSLDKFWIAGEPKIFVVNVKNGGEGALNVLSDSVDLETKIEKKEDGFYIVTLTPHSEGRQQVVLSYGGVDIPDGIFDFECVSSLLGEENVSERTEEFRDGKHLTPYSFRLDVATQYQFSKLTASVKMPSGKDDNTAYINYNGDGTVTVTYHPKESGSHQLFMQHDGINMSGSPISFYVTEAEEEYVTVHGPGLLQAIAGEPTAFIVCAKGSPTKNISVAIEGEAKATIECHDNKDGTCSVVWTPSAPGEYKIHVKVSGKPVKNSPFTVCVADEGQKRAYLSLESTALSEITISVGNAEIEDLSASVRSPNGIKEPCIIRQIDPAHIGTPDSVKLNPFNLLFARFKCTFPFLNFWFLTKLQQSNFAAKLHIKKGASFMPREMGEYSVIIKKNGQIIQKSYFRIEDIKNQIGDVSKVVVSGTGKADAICQQENSFTIDTRDAGNICTTLEKRHGKLSISIQGPSKVELKCTENEGGLANIVYRPTEPGIYILYVKFAGVHVNDSPFTINCTGVGLGIVNESATLKLKEAPVVLPGQDTAIYLQLENISPEDTKAKIVDPYGCSEDIEMRDLGDHLYRIEFKPVVNGPHVISVFYKGQHVSGSPFQFTVGHTSEIGAHKVRLAGIGLKQIETDKKQSFNLYTREAGPGELEVTVEGPSVADLQFHEHEDGNCHLGYKIKQPGEYLISAKFNAEHIPDSPFKVFAVPASGEARRLELISFADSRTLRELCSLIINKHGATGHLEAKLHTPNDRTELVDILPIDENDSYRVRFIPIEFGDYFVDVTLDGIPMRDSPFRFRIGTDWDNDPSVIKVVGNGIRGGQTGELSSFIINTCNAGMGLLQIRIDGPSEVSMNASDVGHLFVFHLLLIIGFSSCHHSFSNNNLFFIWKKVIRCVTLHRFLDRTMRLSSIQKIEEERVDIPGSPFKIVVEGKKLGCDKPGSTSLKINAHARIGRDKIDQVPVFLGDASKVIVRGAGLNKYFPGHFAVFNVDTSLAGENILYVGLHTSKGPCKHVALQNLGNGQYAVKYYIQEEVKGFIFIKYGDVDVPGSPFAITF
uniref:Filamin-A n=1 Tax=Elaeophora elaphi TaxID=1147741 RepID=A0A0R3RZ00_9BILA